MADCIRLDLDCADACRLAAVWVERRSRFVREICLLCAAVCEACAAECARHDAEHCKACARACRHCVDACRRMSRRS